MTQMLRRANANLARRVTKLEYDQSEVIAAMHEAIQTAVLSIEIPNVPAPVIKHGKGTEEVALIFLGDLQLAKVTPTYNTAICERRVERFAEKIALFTNIQRSHHPVKRARVYALGDMVEGELIFPHQPFQIDSGLFTQSMVDGPRIFVNFLRTLLTIFEEIHVVCIPGNHGTQGGASRKAYNPETNWDRVLYYQSQTMLAAEPRLSWAIPHMRNESAWYAVDYPFGPPNDGWLLFHGDQIPNVGSASVGTIARRIWGWQSGAIAEPFGNVAFGHWHTPRYIPLNDMEVYCNGCFVAGTPILTARGPRNIEEINAGDETIGLDGRPHKVEKTWRYDSNEGTVSLGIKGLPYAITATPNHKFFAIKGESVGCAFKRHRLEKTNFSIERPQWITAEMLSPGDWVSVPAPRGILEPVDEDLAWVYGLYLAEGHALVAGGKSKTHYRIQFDMHIREAETHLNKAKQVLDRVLGKTGAVYLRPDRNTSTLYYSGREIAEAWRERFGHKASGKKIDASMLNWSPKLERAIVEGWIAGDGHTRKWKNGNTTRSAVTVSEDLAWGMFMLARGAGMFPFLTRIHKTGNTTGFGGRVNQDIFEINFTGGQDVLCVEGLAFYRICHRRRSALVVPVYDLQTEDHTFVAAGAGVHNSTESTNTFAQERIGAIGQPRQLVLFAHPKHGVTAEYWAKLEDGRIKAPQGYQLPQVKVYPPVPKPAL